jgi:hypothetical protein
MAASYPGSVPDLAALTLSNPQSYAQFTRLIEELQAVFATLGANPQAGSGTVDARLDALDATLLAAANTGYRNLRVANNATTPTTKLDVSADLLAVEGALLSTVAVTIDLTVTGKNGMTATRAVSTWYYVWVGQHGTTGEVCAILDDASSRSLIDVSHASLSGFTRWRRVGARRTNATGSGELPRLTQTDTLAVYETWTDLTGPSTATVGTWATRTISVAVPPTARRALVGTEWANAAATYTQMKVSEVGVDVGRGIGYGDIEHGETWVNLDSAQAFRWVAAIATASNVYWWTVGYHDSI